MDLSFFILFLKNKVCRQFQHLGRKECLLNTCKTFPLETAYQYVRKHWNSKKAQSKIENSSGKVQALPQPDLKDEDVL